MKILIMFLGLIVFNCGEKNGVEMPSPIIIPKDEVYATTDINGLTVELSNHDGRCIVSYRPSVHGAEETERQSLDTGMRAPCDFIRILSTKATPQYYFYGKGDKRWAALLITGGEPHPTIHDRFQPNGCGTYIAKIRVYRDRVELARSGYNGTPSCPSEPLDEVMFAT